MWAIKVIPKIFLQQDKVFVKFSLQNIIGCRYFYATLVCYNLSKKFHRV